MARPRFKPTAKQRERVKLCKADGWSNERIARQLGISRPTLEQYFAEEIEFGADTKRLELIEAMDAAAKKGNASAGKWLHERFDAARAAAQVDQRGETAEPQRKAGRMNKRDELQEAAAKVGGIYAVRPGPAKPH